MKTRSQKVVRLGKDRCELCHKKGTTSNPLTAHHINGNPREDKKENLMALHRIFCHTAGDLITQTLLAYGFTPTREDILSYWEWWVKEAERRFKFS